MPRHADARPCTAPRHRSYGRGSDSEAPKAALQLQLRCRRSLPPSPSVPRSPAMPLFLRPHPPSESVPPQLPCGRQERKLEGLCAVSRAQAATVTPALQRARLLEGTGPRCDQIAAHSKVTRGPTGQRPSLVAARTGQLSRVSCNVLHPPPCLHKGADHLLPPSDPFAICPSVPRIYLFVKPSFSSPPLNTHTHTHTHTHTLLFVFPLLPPSLFNLFA